MVVAIREQRREGEVERVGGREEGGGERREGERKYERTYTHTHTHTHKTNTHTLPNLTLLGIPFWSHFTSASPGREHKGKQSAGRDILSPWRE